jgi:hypothetical protein
LLLVCFATGLPGNLEILFQQMSARIGLSLAFVSLFVCSCGETDPRQQAEELSTLAAAAEMTVEEWLAGSIPGAYAAQTLDGNRRAQEAALEKSRGEGEIAQLARRLADATAEAQRSIRRNDRAGLREPAASIRAAVADLERLSSP